MSHDLKEGVKLYAVHMRAGPSFVSGACEITVSMQTGQAGMVPWAKVAYDDGTRDELLNLEHAARVLLDVPS